MNRVIHIYIDTIYIIGYYIYRVIQYIMNRVIHCLESWGCVEYSLVTVLFTRPQLTASEGG
jgi:hypothetical protein